MANHEACELYIEQQIESGLEDGKSPYAIGKELSVWIARLFEVKIPRETLTTRAKRQRSKTGSNEPNQETPIKPDINGGDSGDKKQGWLLTITEAVLVMKKEIENGKSQRQAAEMAAEKSGRNQETIRKWYQRNFVERNAKEQPTWTCTICDCTFPMSVTTCNCPKAPGVDINSARTGVKIEKLADLKDSIRQTKDDLDKELNSPAGAYLWVGKMNSLLEWIHKTIVEAENKKIPIFEEAAKDNEFIIKWNFLSDKINKSLKEINNGK